MTWSEWHRFSDLKENPAENCGKGVYRVRATLGKDRAVPIHRVCGVDADGILYIGQGNLCDRIGLLMNIWQDDPKRHHHFTSTYIDYCDLDRIADRKLLEVQWNECDDPEAEERRLIDEYVREFGELPPGNLKTGG